MTSPIQRVSSLISKDIGNYLTNKQTWKDIIINVKDYGAKGDGKTDDATAIRSAISYIEKIGGGELFFPDGEYLLGSYISSIELNNYWIFKLPSNITVSGKGDTSVLKVADNINDSVTDGSGGVSIFLANNKTNVHLKNFKVDCNGTKNLVPNGKLRTFYGIKFSTGSNCSVENTTWEDNPGRNVIIFSGLSKQPVTRGGAAIRDNIIRNFGSGVAGNIYQNDASAIYCDWDLAVIEGNRITNDNEPTAGRGGIEIHNSNSIAQNNFMRYCYPGIYLTSDFFMWEPETKYVINDVIIPTRGKFVGRKYICTTAGTSGSTEPDWITTTTDNTITWEYNGPAQKANQVVQQNTLEKCHGGIFIWNGGGDYNSTRIVNNTIGLKRSSALADSTIGGIVQVQGDDDSGLPISVCLNLSIEGNEIFEDDTINSSSEAATLGIIVYSGDNIKVSQNNIHDQSGAPITLLGSSRYLSNVEISDNVIKNFQINDVVSAKGAIVFNLTGSTTIPSVSAYDSTNVSIIRNTITNDVLDSTADGFIFDWGASSVITNLVVADNQINNAAGIKAGAKFLLVTVTPETTFQSATGWVKDKSGLTTQWTRVAYTATAGTNQSFNFPTAFQSANCHVQLTPSNDSTAIASTVSKTASQFTIKCSVSPLDVYVLALGN